MNIINLIATQPKTYDPYGFCDRLNAFLLNNQIIQKPLIHHAHNANAFQNTAEITLYAQENDNLGCLRVTMNANKNPVEILVKVTISSELQRVGVKYDPITDRFFAQMKTIRESKKYHEINLF